MSRTRIATLSGLCGVLIGLIIWSCAELPDLSPNPGSLVRTSRRLYINDFAHNDSLARPLYHGGVYFVLQAYQKYVIHLQTAKPGDRMVFYYFDQIWRVLTPTVGTVDSIGSNGTEDTISIQSNLATNATFAARFLPVDTLTLDSLPVLAASRRPWLKILPMSPIESHSFKVHLFLVGRYNSIPDSYRAAYAEKFLAQLASIFQGYGITLTTSYELVNPTASPDTLKFSSTFAQLPGTRLAGNAHIYLVDAISPSSILGFSPREVENLDMDSTSRVIVAAQDSTQIPNLVNTAAHELGHFFGLRHPMSTSNDTAADNDGSNLEDGLASTPYCPDFNLQAPIASAKHAVSHSSEVIGVQGGKVYCLRTAATLASDCPSDCDITNLMWAYDCSSSNLPVDSLHVLTSEQQTLERQNMQLLQAGAAK